MSKQVHPPFMSKSEKPQTRMSVPFQLKPFIHRSPQKHFNMTTVELYYLDCANNQMILSVI